MPTLENEELLARPLVCSETQVPIPAPGDTRWGPVLNWVISLPTTLSLDSHCSRDHKQWDHPEQIPLQAALAPGSWGLPQEGAEPQFKCRTENGTWEHLQGVTEWSPPQSRGRAVVEILLRGHPISSPVVKHNQTPKDKGPNHSPLGGEGSLEKSREQA